MNRDETTKRFLLTLKLMRYSKGTQEKYLKWFNRFLDYLNFTDSSTLTVYQGQDFLDYLQDEENYCERYYNQAVYALRQLYEGVFEIPVTNRMLPKANPPKTDKSFYTGEQARELVDKCPDPRLKAVIALGFGCGLRISEITKLQFKHVFKGSQNLTIELSKANRTRTVPYSDMTKQILNDYYRSLNLHNFNPDDYLFHKEKKPGERICNSDLTHQFKEYVQTFPFTLPGHTFHSLRHSFATELAMQNVPLPVIQKLMGHSQASTTAQYIHVPERIPDSLPDILAAPGRKN